MSASFLDRFDATWARKRRVQFGHVVALTMLLGTAGFGLLALADYVFELEYVVRACGLAVLGCGMVFFGAKSFWMTVQRWSRPMTAAEIEQAFPELGQSIRTTVQFTELQEDEVRSQGVVTNLVSALAEQTEVRTQPLGLDVIVPAKRLWLLTTSVIAALLVFAVAAGMNWEWRTASNRVILAERPYRSLMVEPGDVLIDEGAGTRIRVALVGRTNRDVVLFTRPAGQRDAEWTARTLEPLEREENPPRGESPSSGATPANAETSASGDRGADSGRVPNFDPPLNIPRAEFVAAFDRLMKPLDYRVNAGDLESQIFRIDIRHPLKLHEVKVELTPPAYTGQSASTSLDPNLSVLQGTVARFFVTFDKQVASASLVLAPRKQARDDGEPNEPEAWPLSFEESSLASHDEAPPKSVRRDDPLSNDPAERDAWLASWSELNSMVTGVVELTLTEDRTYSIVAEAADGTRLPDNKFRIRVREDQPPQVFFESPDDAIEVHTLAELPMRVRVRDDYGLTRAGVIFQVNNEQEIPLIAEDFQTVVDAAQEVAATGTLSLTTQTLLEKVLPLEFFELTQKDSVMYFAFAEDNRPDKPQRTETDMRFIDIRPFKRTFQVIDPDPMPGMGMGPGLKSLEELIQKQRFGLNRTMQIEKRAAVGRKPDATTLDQLMQFETELAKNVRETAEGLEARGFDDTELFYQAETAMLAAVDSLSVGKWENATLQMKDALKALIEQRDRTLNFIRKNPDAARLAALRAFDRMQAQKLRRPKTDKEEARELIRRLEALISEETSVAEALGDEKSETQNPKPETNPNEETN